MKKILLLISALFILAGINSLNAQILPKGSTWKYLDDGSDQGTAWKEIGFDDAGWASGMAPLGYGKISGDPVVDTLSYGPDGDNKYTTTYFRTTFDYTPTGTEIGYVINLLVDDGAVFYFNGVEAARWNMPRETLDDTTFAVGWGNEYWGEFLLLDKSHIVSGTNELAVEVHQGSFTSSDMGFDIEIIVDPGDLFPDNKYFIMDATDDGEEEVETGAVDLGSSDLELATDGSDAQIIGMRFSNILVDPDDVVTSASIQFTSDGSSSGAVRLKIEGEKIADSPFFTETDSNFANRTRTTAHVIWSPADWTAEKAGAEQKTPDLSAIVQEIIDQPGWASGNHMTFFITGIDGEYRRAFTKTAQNESGTSSVLEIKSTAPILSKGSTWKYLDDGSDQGTAWKEIGFDDAGWASGMAPLGYGKISGDPVVDTLSYGPDENNKFTTTYFRTTFDYTPTGSEIGYAINLLVDDGAVFYFNGVEAARWNMPRETLDDTTFAVGWGNEYWGEFLLIDKSHIVSGTNELAVEVHQGSKTSSDMGFDIEIFVDPGDLFPANTYFIMDATDDGEEDVATGAVDLGSSDLELATDGSDAQIVGMRFSNILVEPGETVSSASIQFTSDGSSSGAVNLKIEGEKIADSPFFTETDADFSNRTRTTAHVIWSPADWTADTAGAEQKTLDLSTIVQEIIDQPGWASGNHMTFIITGIDGEYRRAFTKTAQNNSGTSPKLVINTINVLSNGSTWKYLDDGSDQGTAWKEIGFDDSGWASGTAPLGYGKISGDPVVDTLSYGPDENNKFTTTYFRTTFDYTPTGTEIGYVINLLVDDGAVFYFNGVEAARWNMPRETLADTTFAVGWGNEYWGEFLLLDKSHIVSGMNTLAVEVHQGSFTSSDMGFDIEIIVDPGDLFPANKYFIMDATDDGEEDVVTGAVDLGSSDLELATDGSDAQIIGMRFSNILVDPGETVSSASIQFTSDGSSSGAVNLKIEGEKIADSPFFTETDSNFYMRAKTTANVSWSPPDWAADTAGAEQKTPDLTAIVQEIIDLGGWASGNHMTFFINGIDGAYRRAFTKTAQNESGTSPVLEILTGGTAIRVVGERENLILVYPNPAENYFYIKNPTEEKFGYRVRNITGQLIMQRDQISGERATVHLSKSGLYIVEIMCADKVYTQKVIMK